MKRLLDQIALFWSSLTSKTAIPFAWDMQTQGDPLRCQPRFTPNCSFSSICFTASAALHTGRHPAHQLGHVLLSSASSSSSPLSRQGEEGGGGGVWREAEPLWLRNQILRGLPPPRRIVIGSQNGHGRHTRES